VVSIHAIADKEGISETQVRLDLKEATAPGDGAVEPKKGKVKGKDGKTRRVTAAAGLPER
jgi:hypothetical protein